DHVSWMEAGLAVYSYLQEKDCNSLETHFKTLFASIPNDWYRNNPISNYEGYYASVFYSHLAALGLNIVAEDVSNLGRCDLAVIYADRVYLFEFKVIDGEEPTGEAIKQLKTKGYAAKYKSKYTDVLQIGIEFSKLKRQIVGWECV
ncbi:MAG: PD-(D/E)XK nuclease domain-containing protein, partial [Deltaproteobacteria bacterium]